MRGKNSGTAAQIAVMLVGFAVVAAALFVTSPQVGESATSFVDGARGFIEGLFGGGESRDEPENENFTVLDSNQEFMLSMNDEDERYASFVDTHNIVYLNDTGICCFNYTDGMNSQIMRLRSWATVISMSSKGDVTAYGAIGSKRISEEPNAYPCFEVYYCGGRQIVEVWTEIGQVGSVKASPTTVAAHVNGILYYYDIGWSYWTELPIESYEQIVDFDLINNDIIYSWTNASDGVHHTTVIQDIDLEYGTWSRTDINATLNVTCISMGEDYAALEAEDGIHLLNLNNLTDIRYVGKGAWPQVCENEVVYVRYDEGESTLMVYRVEERQKVSFLNEAGAWQVNGASRPSIFNGRATIAMIEEGRSDIHDILVVWEATR